MVKLIASEPFAGRLPLEADDLRIDAYDPGQMTLVLAGRGKAPKVAGMAFPAPGRVSLAGEARLQWMAPGQAMLMGAPVPGLKSLRYVDQSDAWAIARLEGAAGPEVLARLVPVDLRLSAFGVGATARTLIGHMTGSVTRVAEDVLEVMVMRSMAGSLVHDVQRAVLTSAR